MYKIHTGEYINILKSCYEVKQPLFVHGACGIGKSAIPRQVFKELSSHQKRIFVEWSDLSIEQRKQCIEDPQKYFVFMDVRASQMDTTSLIGIPNMTKTDLLENIPYSWVVYFTTPGSSGVIFADELNLAAPIIQSITYSLIHDRVISDRRLSADTFIFAAGNRAQDKAHTFDMPMPLRDRFAECELVVDVEQWIKWASQVSLNPHLISFINWKPSNLYNADKIRNEKPSTPRGVERASKLLNGYDIADEKTHMLISISCGESFATEFQAYCKIHSKLDWENILKNPSLVSEMSIDQQYAICGGIVDQIKRRNNEISYIALAFDVVDCLREDFAIFSYRLIKDSITPSGFKNIMLKLGRTKQFATKYAKYLLDGVT